ncbi:hypothetical protein BDR07DRAFT_1485973 [Suillus spraguei]|nr:hypothetical protein BDR07DRAFT_1485973 [Suillus spraguei]
MDHLSLQSSAPILPWTSPGAHLSSILLGTCSSSLTITPYHPEIVPAHSGAHPEVLRRSIKLSCPKSSSGLHLDFTITLPWTSSEIKGTYWPPIFTPPHIFNPLPSSLSRSATTPAATNSYSFPPVSSTPIPTAPDTLLPAASVPPVSSAPGRCSACMTRPSTRVQDANKIGDNAKAVTSKCKRKGMAEAIAGKSLKNDIPHFLQCNTLRLDTLSYL